MKNKEYFASDVVDLGDPFGMIEVYEMSGNEAEEYESGGSRLIRRKDQSIEIIVDEQKKRKAVFKIVAACCESENGMVIDAKFLGDLPRTRLQKIMDTFKRVNGIGGEDAQALDGDDSDSVGNSPTIQ
jgi:hypothetical protein